MVYFLKYNAPTTVFCCFAYFSKDNEKLTFPLTTVAKLKGNSMGVLHCEQIIFDGTSKIVLYLYPDN